MILSAKRRRNELGQNEQLWQILDISDMFGPTFGFKNSQPFQFEE